MEGIRFEDFNPMAHDEPAFDPNKTAPFSGTLEYGSDKLAEDLKREVVTTKVVDTPKQESLDDIASTLPDGDGEVDEELEQAFIQAMSPDSKSADSTSKGISSRDAA